MADFAAFLRKTLYQNRSDPGVGPNDSCRIPPYITNSSTFATENNVLGTENHWRGCTSMVPTWLMVAVFDHIGYDRSKKFPVTPLWLRGVEVNGSEDRPPICLQLGAYLNLSMISKRSTWVPKAYCLEPLFSLVDLPSTVRTSKMTLKFESLQ